MSKSSTCCTVCSKISSITKDIEVNSRAHLAMRTLGKERAGMATFSGMMDMHPPITSKYYGNHRRLKVATEAERDANMSAAVSLLRKDAAPDAIVDVKVTCDGTWSKQGHTALFRVIIVAAWETGQVLDMEVLSKRWRLDRCWTWRCSASGAACTRRRGRSVLTPLPLHFWMGGRSIRLFADKTTMGHLVQWRWKG